MKKITDPLSYERVKGKINNKNITKKAFLLVMVPFFTLWNNFYYSIHEQEVYNEMNIVFNDNKTIEYSTEFDPMSYIDEVSIGDIVYSSTVNTNVLGHNRVLYIVSDGIINKEFYNEIDVIDTNSPEINIEDDEVSIYVNEKYDVISNVISVYDQVDGELPYKDDDTGSGYYTITTDFDASVAGDYNVNVKAVDLSGNISEKSYTIKVKEKEKVKYTYSYTNYNISASVDTTSVVSAAYSLIGYNYTYGGASPETGFDCTGFVYYIYGLFGKTVGRSSSDIVYSGTGVSRDNISAGDIIVWSTYSNNTPTHAALYVGDGMMIHAANSRQGVILSSVDDWGRGSAHIVAIRRV